jgi:nicotinamidase-related amidase
MSSEPIRDPVRDHLLTPQNAAFIIIDYQPVQVNSIASMERQRLVSNIVRASKAALLYGLPIVHSTVNVKTGINKPAIAPLRKIAREGSDLRPHDHQRLGGHRVPRGGRRNRPQKADHDGAVDRSLLDLPCA